MNTLKRPELIHQAMAYDIQLRDIYQKVDALRQEANELTKKRDQLVQEIQCPVLTVVK